MSNRRTTLLFLHGFPMNPSMWEAQRTTFEEKGYHVVTPDLRLEGKIHAGGLELPEPVTMEQMADAAVAALDKEGVEQAVVIGFSMGGYVAFSMLERYPQKVAALVLTDTRAEADSPEGKEGRLKLAKAVQSDGAKAAADAMIGKLLSPKTVEAKPELVQAVERLMLDASPAAIASAALGLAERSDRTSMLPSIQVPTLVIVGEDDVITPPDVARKMAGGIDGAALEVIPHAGHMPNMEQPELFNKALSLWLSGKGL